MVEQLAGDSNLIAVRSRASRERPFTVVQKMQADADANYRSKIKELEQNLAETQRKVNELQKSKEGGQRFILSPEQQQELANFRKTEAEAKVQLKEMRKKLRAEIDSLENRIKWINIAGMPAAVIAAGFCPRDDETQARRGMKGKQLALILVLLAVIGGAALFFYHRSNAIVDRNGDHCRRKRFSTSRLTRCRTSRSRVTRLKLNLAKTDGVWKVKERADYPANFELISDLITKVWELPAVQDVKVGPSQFGRLAIAAARSENKQRHIARSEGWQRQTPRGAAHRKEIHARIQFTDGRSSRRNSGRTLRQGRGRFRARRSGCDDLLSEVDPQT